MEFAPIVIFTYRRLQSLKVLINSLHRNPEAIHSEVFIFCDGARGKGDQHDVEQVQQFAQSIEGFARVHCQISERNHGLANSVIKGVSEVYSKYTKAIVIEDDLEVSSNFLAYMNQALDRYESESKVYSISGYSFDLKKPRDYTSDVYFLNRGWSWTWATWKERWEQVDWNVADYSSFSANTVQQKEFAKMGSDVNAMLRKQMEGKIDSWAIRWVYQQFKCGGLTVYPVVSKVYNHGFDQVATHNVGSNRRYITELDKSDKVEFHWPDQILITSVYQKKFNGIMSIPRRIISRLESIWVQLKRSWK
jgi:hypothetical protein